MNRRGCSIALAPELVARSPMPASRPDTSSNAPFPTTRWSQVVAAGDRADPAAREALAELCAAYWYPLYAFVRRKGHPPDEAADLVQGTFVDPAGPRRPGRGRAGARPVPLVPDGRLCPPSGRLPRPRPGRQAGRRAGADPDRSPRRGGPLRGRAGRRADGRAALRAALGHRACWTTPSRDWRRNRSRPGRPPWCPTCSRP